MQRILGLDLGTNSIGWAVVEKTSADEGKIVDTGVRIFPEGVENLGEGEKEMSKNAARRMARQIRRQGFRRKMRKRLLLTMLAENGMCPLDSSLTSTFKAAEPLPDLPELREWFRLNPYELRSKALKEKISLMELGRVFYHIAQRRGFQTNSRNASDEGKIFEGNAKEGKTGIDETLGNMGDRTLGQYLNTLLPEPNKSYQTISERARNRYTTRAMYTDEFDKIWQVQAPLHPQLNDELRQQFGGRRSNGDPEDGILFFQRPLRSQKYLIGKCTLEPSKPRCPISAIDFELFRAHQFVNTIEYNGRRLNEKQRNIAMDVLTSKEKPKFNAIRKKLKMTGADLKFNYADDDTCPGTYTISQLSSKKFFGDRFWDMTEKERDDIWHTLVFFDDKSKLFEYAQRNWGFDDKAAEGIAKLKLKQGYSHLSRKAIRNILPFLEIGKTYDVAVALGGVKNAFGARWEKLNHAEIEFLIDRITEIVRTNATGGFIHALRDFLVDHYSLSDKALSKLYHHSTNIHAGELLDKLPVGKDADREIQKVRNPIVIQALLELRKVVNQLIDRYGKIDVVKIELARDLKVSKKHRADKRFEQKRLEAMNDYVVKELVAHNLKVNHDNILKYKLWLECEKTCPFTGKAISLSDLFSGSGVVQIEHIFPWSRSLDDSFMNKTLCYADANRAKGKRTPYEYFNQDFGPDKWEEVKERAIKLFYDSRDPKKYFPHRYQKYKRFIAKQFDDDFVSRQLNDTRYISREASNYLKRICKEVIVSPGHATSILRHYWGLNSILSIEGEKTRADHRHHAIDALVMACTERSFIKRLADYNQLDRASRPEQSFPDPWPDFREEADRSVSSILVSHKRRTKVVTTRKVFTKKNGVTYVNKGISARGQLHLDSVFGKPKNATNTYHIRKPLESITTATHVKKIVEPRIRELIERRIQEMGGYTGSEKKKDKVPNGAFFSYDEEGNRIPLIKLPNSKGDDVPVYKVRIKENLGNAEQLHHNVNRYVNPRNNHHILLYLDDSGELQEDCVQFWQAVERIAQGQRLLQLPPGGKEIVARLSENEMFLIDPRGARDDWKNMPRQQLAHYLYRVQKISSNDYSFRLHNAASLENINETQRLSLKKFSTLAPCWVRIEGNGNILF